MYGFRVEGVGNFDGLFNFIDGPVSSAQDRNYLVRVPDSSIQIDYLDGRTSLVSGEFKVINNDETRALFRAKGDPFVALVVDATSTQIEFDSYTGHNNTVVWCRRGAIRLLNEIAPNRYNCTLGWLDTPRENYALPGDNRVYDHPRVLKGRMVTKFERYAGLERIIDVSELENTGHSQGDSSYSLYTRSGLPGAFQKSLLRRKWAADPQDVRTTRNGLRTEVTYLRYKADTLPLTLVGSSQQDIYVRWDGGLYKSTFDPSSGYGSFDPRNTIWTDRPSVSIDEDDWRSKQVEEVVLFQRDDAINVIMKILTSTPSGLNGPYDTGMDLIGFSRYRFDMSAIGALRERISAFTRVDRLVFDYSESDILGFIEDKLLAPHMLTFTIRQGLLSISLWEDTEVVEAYTDADILVNPWPSQSDGRDRQDDSVLVNWSPNVLNIDDSRSLEVIDGLGLYVHGAAKKQVVVDATTISNYQAALIVALNRIIRIKDAIPIFTFAVDTQRATAYPGDDVQVTSRQLIESGYGKVISRDERVRDGYVLYRVLMTNIPDRSVIGFAARIEVDSGSVWTVTDGLFSGSAYSFDIQPVQDTWTVDIIDEYGIILQAGIVVKPLDDLTIEYLTTITVTTVGNYIVSSTGPAEGEVETNTGDLWR